MGLNPVQVSEAGGVSRAKCDGVMVSEYLESRLR